MATKKKKDDGFRTFDILPFQTPEDPNTVDPNYIPEGFDSVEDFLQDMRKEYQNDLDFDYNNRREAIDDKQFAAGEQWDPQVLKNRQGLPCLKINTVPQFIAQLVGDWRQDRNGIKVIPAADGDVAIADIRGDLIRAIEQTSKATRVYDNAFESVCQCGDGAFRVNVEYARNSVFDQDIFIRPIDDALSVIWDRMSVDVTGRDARHVFVDDTMPVTEYRRRFGNIAYSSLNDITETARAELRAGGWLKDDEARVTEYWRMIERDKLWGLFEDGSMHELDGEKFAELSQKHGQLLKSRMTPVSYAQMHLVTGFAILGGPYEYKLSRLPIIRMMGRYVNIAGRRVRYGLVRFMKDAVRLRNFWRSIAAEQLGYAPKAQWLATESAVEGREDDFRRAHLSRDPLLIVNDDAQIDVTIKRLDPPAPQMALLNEAQINAQDMKDITGLHDASLGIKSNETSGKAIMARQHEGDVASLTYYDNGNAAVLEAGDVINQLIPQIYDSTRIIRVVGADEAVKLIKINDPMDPHSPDLSTGLYDVMMTTGASYTTRREAAADAMMNAIQVFPELMQVAGDKIVKAQDWPGAEEIADRLIKTIPPQLLSDKEKQDNNIQPQPPAIPPQMQEAMAKMQEELQRLTLENGKLMLANKDKELELQIKRYEAVSNRLKALTDNMVDQNSVEMSAVSEILNQARHEQTLDHQAQQAEADRNAAAQQAQAKAASQSSNTQ